MNRSMLHLNPKPVFPVSSGARGVQLKKSVLFRNVFLAHFFLDSFFEVVVLVKDACLDVQNIVSLMLLAADEV